MTNEDFINWLRGFMAGKAGAHPTTEQYKMIQDNLASVRQDAPMKSILGGENLTLEVREEYFRELEEAHKYFAKKHGCTPG